MKRIMYRLIRNRCLWLIIVSMFVITTVLSIVYCREEPSDDDRWLYYISRYDNEDELKEQIAELEQEIREADSKEYSYFEDDTEEFKIDARKSINIMEYILDKGYSYDEIVEGGIYTDAQKERRSFSFYSLEIVFILQIVSSVFIIWMISNQGRNNGSHVMDYMLYGRKSLFKDELLTYVFMNLITFVIHIALTFSMRMMLPQTTRYVLYYNNGNIKVFTENTEYVLAIVSVFLMLLWLQAIVFCISKAISNSLLFGVTSLLAVGIWIYIVNITSIKPLKMMGMLCPSNYEENGSMLLYWTSVIIRTIMAVALYGIAYMISKKKRINIVSE